VKTLTVKITERLAAEIEAEARSTGTTKSDVVRRRLECPQASGPRPLTMWDVTHDLIEKLEGETSTLPRDFSARKKHYLRKWGFGKKRHR